LALGCKDPVARVNEIKARDPERQRVVELFTTWWECHANNPVKASELALEVQEIAEPSKRGRRYLARAIGNLAGTRQGGFLLERFGDLPSHRKQGARYRLVVQLLPAGDRRKSSASSAPYAEPKNTIDETTACQSDSHGDDLGSSAGHPRASAGIRGASAPPKVQDKPIQTNDFGTQSADNADDADDLTYSSGGKSPVANPGPDPEKNSLAHRPARNRSEMLADEPKICRHSAARIRAHKQS
jgi:hypothetical protein